MKLATVPKKPTTLLPVVQPPPRKEDVVKALVERARAKHAEERAKLEAQQAAARDAFDSALIAELAANPSAFERGIRCRSSYSPEVQFTLGVLPPKIKKLRDAINATPSLRPFDEKEVRKSIRESLGDSGSRVNALLNNPDAVKALDAMLEKL